MNEQAKPEQKPKSLKQAGLRALSVGLMGLIALPYIGPLVVIPITAVASELAGGVAGAYTMGLTSVGFIALPAALSFAWNAHRNK